MAPAVALGLARFAYALLPPTMRADLGWTYASAGAVNNANAAGYLAGAIGAATVASCCDIKATFIVSLFATVVVVGASGLTVDFWMLTAPRFAAGFLGTVAFVTGGSLAAAAAGGGSPRAPLVHSLYSGGGGIGVMISALVIPNLIVNFGWRAGWLALGALGFIACLVALPALLRVPRPPLDVIGAGGNLGWSARFMAPELIGYALFGAGYIAYATFIVAHLRDSFAFTTAEVSFFWASLGFASIVAAFAWSPILARVKGGWGAAATIAVVMIGAVLPLILRGKWAAYLSAALFGGSFLAVIAAVTTFARRAAPPHAWTSIIGALTIAFGIGQCIGPVLGGVLPDGPDGVRAGLLLSIVILAVAATVSTFQAEPRNDS
jgi:predicted MFS family arabinose efflux permease